MPAEPVHPARARADSSPTPAQPSHPARARTHSSPTPMSGQGV